MDTNEQPETPEPTRVNLGPAGTVDLDRLFGRHKPNPTTAPLYDVISNMGHTFATVISKVCPPGPERSIAITKVREATMWANNAIAVNPGPQVNEPETVEEAEQALQVARQSAADAERDYMTAVAEAEQHLARLRAEAETDDTEDEQ